MTKSLNVTLFGNVNNEMYRFAVALKRQQDQVRLVTLEEGKLHDPSSIRYQSPDLIPEILRTGLNDLDMTSFSNFFKDIVVDETSKSDFAIFTGSTIAYACFARSPYSLFLSGSDAILLTSYRLPILRILASPKRIRGFVRYGAPLYLFVFLQRRSIKRAAFWLSLPETSFTELRSLKSRFRRPDILQIYLPVVLENQTRDLNGASKGLIRVLLVGRFNRKSKNSSISLDDKGSLTALIGVLEFARLNPNLIEFSFFSKGDISEECMTLIGELAGVCKVVQKDEATFSDFINEVACAEVIIDSVGASPAARNSIEALSLGKFVIANFYLFNPLDYCSDNSELRSLTFSANSSTSVFNGLEKYMEMRSFFLKNAPVYASEIRLGFSPWKQGVKLKHLIQSHVELDAG